MLDKSDIFKDVSDLPKLKGGKKARDLVDELFSMKNPNQIIDEYEKKMGYPQKQEKIKVKFKNRVFTPTHADDQELLNELINDEDKYKIVMWKETWTVHGDYKIFIIYSERVDDAKVEEQKLPEETI